MSLVSTSATQIMGWRLMRWSFMRVDDVFVAGTRASFPGALRYLVSALNVALDPVSTWAMRNGFVM